MLSHCFHKVAKIQKSGELNLVSVRLVSKFITFAVQKRNLWTKDFRLLNDCSISLTR